MLRDLLSSRTIQAGLAFFVLVVGGSLLYNWHIQRTTAAELERHDRFLRGLKNKNEIRPAQAVNDPTDTEPLGFVDMPDENTDTPMSDATEALPNETENLDITDVFLLDDMDSKEEPTEDVPVSPFGFGPYPEPPEGWPPVPWKGLSRNRELMTRVQFKLANQGIPVVGSMMANGIVYPTIRGVRYVEWEWSGFPPRRYITTSIGTTEDGDRLRAIKARLGRPLTAADVPSDIELRPYNTAGIDPYTFLDLPR